MVAANVIAADDEGEARRLFTSVQQAFTNMVRDRRGRLQPPIDDIEQYWSPSEKAHASRMLQRSFVGSADMVGTGLQRFIDETAADELIIASAIHDHAARLRSYEILAGIQTTAAASSA
jgi:alkanesulfonate monooxygenase SsuD/methylene tetrahydromethanopterin reductase-like flavin-dependent oxidoreductase (luciferase family)